MIKTVFHFSMLVVIGLLLVAGCGDDEVEPVNFLTVTPPDHSAIQPDSPITLFFDGIPKNVNVNQEEWTTDNRKVIISGDFPPGPLNIKITWSDSVCVPNRMFAKLNYTVKVLPGDDSSDMKANPTDESQAESISPETDKEKEDE